MKRKFLKFLPLATAVLLATSCSKDDSKDEHEVVNLENQEVVVNNGVKEVPFTITVGASQKLSKISYTDTEENTTTHKLDVVPKFEPSDKDNLWMVVTGTGINESTLTLTDVSDGGIEGTFTGKLKVIDEEIPSELKLTGTITVPATDDHPTYSTNSIAELMKNCGHVYTTEDNDLDVVYDEGKKQYHGNKTVELIDNKAYLEIFMSPFANHDIKVNDDVYTVKDGRLWIAVTGEQTVTISGDNLGTISDKVVKAANIYTIARHYFTVDDKGTKVYFSPGNLQATTTDFGTTWSWGFAENQYDYIGKKAANTSINGNGSVSVESGTVDLFGWVGASSTWTGAAQYGISNSTSTNNADGYGKESNEDLNDWGNLIKEGSPWRTLKITEWQYLLGGVYGITPRDKATDLRKWGNVNGFDGLIILPDGCTCSFSEDWSTLEAAGAVFLPAAGYRSGTEAFNEGLTGGYWSSSANGEANAWYLFFNDDGAFPDGGGERFYGQSVRLVRSL